MYLIQPTCTITVGIYMYTEVIYGYTYNYGANIKLPVAKLLREICLN